MLHWLLFIQYCWQDEIPLDNATLELLYSKRFQEFTAGAGINLEVGIILDTVRVCITRYITQG